MSYILEALRRAESERERKRGGVPGLHARPVAPSPDDTGERRSTPWGWVASGLSIGVLLMILWRWWSVEPLVDEDALARAPVGGNVSQGSADPATAAPPSSAAPVPASAPPEPAPAPQAAPGPAPKGAASAAPDRPPRTGKPAPPPRSTATAAAPTRDAQSAAPPLATAQAPPQSGTAARNTAPAPLPTPAAPPERLRTLTELPDDLRRSVPQLAFGGSVYSETPSQRMVILNGQVMREGDAVTDDLQIEQIRPRSAVLRLRGQRFEMPF